MLENMIKIKDSGKLNSSTNSELLSKITPILIAFLIIHSLKLTLFNFVIMNNHSIESFIFKCAFSMLITYVVYSSIFKLKSHWGFILLYTVESVYIFANITYFGYFHNYLHLFQSAALFTEGVGSIKHFTIPVDYKDLILLMDLPFFIMFLRRYYNFSSYIRGTSLYRKTVVIVFLLLIAGNEILSSFYSSSTLQIAKDYTTGEQTIVQRYGTITNNLCDIIFNSGGKNLISHLKYGNNVTGTVSKLDKPNVICIQVESMDANVVNQKFKGQYIAPFLNKISQENIYYPYMLSYHKAGGTSDSEFSILNSVEPLSSFPSIKLAKYQYPNSIVKRLSDNSYDTIAFHGNIGNYYNRDIAFPKMGFKEFVDIEKMGFKDSGWGASDGDVLKYAFNKLESAKNPFFSYIITMSSHTPFTSVKNYYNNNIYDSIENDRVKNYFNSITYVDQAINSFVQDIKGKFPNTYIFIWGDHTPDINEDEYKQASLELDGNYLEFVPLIVITPDNKKYTESQKVESFLDIAPTVLTASGIQFSIDTYGSNLINSTVQPDNIPFNGNSFNRNDLFSRIVKIKTGN